MLDLNYFYSLLWLTNIKILKVSFTFYIKCLSLFINKKFYSKFTDKIL